MEGADLSTNGIVVIMPTYRCRDWLPRAIESVLCQTWPNVDLYVVDDAGDDVDKALAGRFESVSFIRMKRQTGPYTIANLIILLTKSDYIAFHDADDWSKPTRFAAQIEYLNNTQCEGCGSWYVRTDVYGDPVGFETCPDDASSAIRRSFSGNPILHPATIYRRRVFDRLMGFDGQTRFAADSEFLWRASFNTRLGNVQKFLYYHVVHPGSLTESGETGFSSTARAIYSSRILQAAEQIRDNPSSFPGAGKLLTGDPIQPPDPDLIEWLKPGKGNRTLSSAIS